MKKRILITGEAGSIDSHLCEKLLNENNEVICIDNFFTGSKQNIVHLLNNPYFEVVRYDITFSLYMELNDFNLTYVSHDNLNLLPKFINSNFPTEINIPIKNIKR